MRQLWTFIFVTLVAIAWALAAWHDHAEKKRQERRDAAFHEKDKKSGRIIL